MTSALLVFGTGTNMLCAIWCVYMETKSSIYIYFMFFIAVRCYRIRYNKKQMRVDRLSIVGAIAGVAAASYLGESAALGALLGLNTGMVLAFVCNSTIGV